MSRESSMLLNGPKMLCNANKSSLQHVRAQLNLNTKWAGFSLAEDRSIIN